MTEMTAPASSDPLKPIKQNYPYKSKRFEINPDTSQDEIKVIKLSLELESLRGGPLSHFEYTLLGWSSAYDYKKITKRLKCIMVKD